MTGSNRRPSACKADALPAELILHENCDERRISASTLSIGRSRTSCTFSPALSRFLALLAPPNFRDLR